MAYSGLTLHLLIAVAAAWETTFYLFTFSFHLHPVPTNHGCLMNIHSTLVCSHLLRWHYYTHCNVVLIFLFNDSHHYAVGFSHFSLLQRHCAFNKNTTNRIWKAAAFPQHGGSSPPVVLEVFKAWSVSPQLPSESWVNIAQNTYVVCHKWKQWHYVWPRDVKKYHQNFISEPRQAVLTWLQWGIVSRIHQHLPPPQAHSSIWEADNN